MPQKLKIAMVGLGHAATAFHLPCLVKFEDVELYFCEIDEERLRKAAAKFHVPEERTYTDLNKMLKEIKLDAAYVMLPQYRKDGHEEPMYEKIVEQVAREKLPIFVEKPLGVNKDHASRLLKLVETNKIKTTMCGFQRRFNPLLCHALQRIQERGPLLQASFSFFKGMLQKDRCEEGAYKNYNWLTLDLIHCLDLARWVPDGEIASFWSSKRSYPKDWSVYSEFHSVMTFEGGATSFFSSNVRVGGRILRFELHGPGISVFITSEPNDGNIEEADLDTSHHDMVARIHTTDGTNPYASLPKPEIVHSYDVSPVKNQHGIAGWWSENRHFIDCVKKNSETDSSFEDAYKTIELCDKILEN